MYLYQMKDENVEIYKIISTRRLCSYKEAEMDKIPFEMRVMDVITNDFSRGRDNLENAEDSISYFKFVYNYVDRDFNTCDYSKVYRINEYSSSKEIKEAKRIVSDYSSQKKSVGKVLEVNSSKDEYINYLLLTRSCYTHHGRESYMSDIICLPKSLYLLELFLQQRFDLLTDEDISEILKLYDIEGLVKKISLEELQDLRKYNIISKKEFKKIENKIGKSEKVLRLINA